MTSTTTKATIGSTMARIDRKSEPPASTVETTGLPTPPVAAVDAALVIPVPVWMTAAEPPPAISASAHFTAGSASPSIAPVAMVPATTAIGVVTVSSRLSTQGM